MIGSGGCSGPTGRSQNRGPNSVVVEDVPPRSTVVGNPGHPVRIEGCKVTDGPDADRIHLPTPAGCGSVAFSPDQKDLQRRVAELSGEPKPDARTGRSRGPELGR